MFQMVSVISRPDVVFLGHAYFAQARADLDRMWTVICLGLVRPVLDGANLSHRRPRGQLATGGWAGCLMYPRAAGTKMASGRYFQIRTLTRSLPILQMAGWPRTGRFIIQFVNQT